MTRALAFGLCALLAGLGSTAAAAAADERCQPPMPGTKPLYTVGCGGKSVCLPSDTLEIKPLDKDAKRITAVCLLVGAEDADATPEPLDNPAVTTAAATVAYGLAPMLHDWLNKKDKTALAAQLKAVPGGRLAVTAVLTDVSAERFNARFIIDLNPLWTSGMLPLVVGKVECDPCGLDGTLTLTVSGLWTWKQAGKVDPAKLSLMVEGIKLPAMAPEVAAAGVDGTLTYQLRRVASNAENLAAWDRIVERALAGKKDFHAGIANDQGELARATETTGFVLPGPGRRYGAPLLLLLIGGLVLLFIGLSTRWRWLRDSYGLPAVLVPAKGATFSLARSQMAWWTAVVALSWFGIGMATGHWNSITDSALVLMGISVATAAGAVAAVPEKLAKLKADLNTAKAALDAPKTAAAESAIRNDVEFETKGWLADVTTDYSGNTTGLHRVQSLLFTAIFGFWFGYQALTTGAMPAVPTTMLALMGISGSTYVGFKMAAAR